MLKVCHASRHSSAACRRLTLSFRGLTVRKLVLLIVLTMSMSLYADEDESMFDDFGAYVGAGIGFISTGSDDAFDGPVSFKVGEVLGGLRWRWFGFEYRTGQSVEDEVIDVDAIDPDTGQVITARTAISSYETGFLRIQLENEIARIYVLVGRTEAFTSTSYSHPIGEDEITFEEVTATGGAYGVGAGFEVNEHLFFNLEYKSLYESENLSLPMVGATIDFHIF